MRLIPVCDDFVLAYILESEVIVVVSKILKNGFAKNRISIKELRLPNELDYFQLSVFRVPLGYALRLMFETNYLQLPTCRYLRLLSADVDITRMNITELPAGIFTRLRGILANAVVSSDWVFTHCGALTDVRMNSLTELRSSAFKHLEISVAHFESVQSIGEHCFEGCTKLSDLRIPACRKLGVFALASCPKLRSLDLPRLTKLGNGAFMASGLTSLKLPKLKAFTLSAIEGCTNLRSLHLDSCTSVKVREFDAVHGTFHGLVAFQNVQDFYMPRFEEPYIDIPATRYIGGGRYYLRKKNDNG